MVLPSYFIVLRFLSQKKEKKTLGMFSGCGGNVLGRLVLNTHENEKKIRKLPS